MYIHVKMCKEGEGGNVCTYVCKDGEEGTCVHA